MNLLAFPALSSGYIIFLGHSGRAQTRRTNS